MDAILSWWFITIHFTVFFFSKPCSAHASIWSSFSHSLAEKGDWCGAFLDSHVENTDAKVLLNFSAMVWSFSDTSFSSDHLLAPWMLWQVSSLWCVWKGLVIRFYDFSMKTCPVILHVSWHNYALCLVSAWLQDIHRAFGRVSFQFP